MAFLFKSKKQQSSALPSTSRNVTSADESSNVSISSGNGPQKDGEKPRFGPPPPIGLNGIPAPPVRGVMSPSPDMRTLRERNEQDISMQVSLNPAMLSHRAARPCAKTRVNCVFCCDASRLH